MKKIVLIVLLIFFISLAAVAQAQDGIVVIVNKQNPLNAISKGQLSNIYRGQETMWPNGQRIVLVNQAIGSDARSLFYQRVLKVSPAAKFYIPGTMAPIRTALQKTGEGVKLFISNMPQTIGYILEKEVDDSVKVLMIDGGKVIY
ncbi:MAG: substrate-binding domain-containing protein [Gammaproteobacteria bacterium]|nr:substrate-binding domain-containing protein [Gammaproteobacteria bacterium]